MKLKMIEQQTRQGDLISYVDQFSSGRCIKMMCSVFSTHPYKRFLVTLLICDIQGKCPPQRDKQNFLPSRLRSAPHRSLQVASKPSTGILNLRGSCTYPLCHLPFQPSAPNSLSFGFIQKCSSAPEAATPLYATSRVSKLPEMISPRSRLGVEYLSIIVWKHLSFALPSR